jgi:hypothetical protein
MPHDVSSNSVVMTAQKSLNHWTKDAKRQKSAWIRLSPADDEAYRF